LLLRGIRDRVESPAVGRSKDSFPGGAFSGTADPSLLFLDAARCDTRDLVLRAIRSRRGVITLSGAGGLGKTALLRRIAHDLGDECDSAFVGSDCRTLDDLLRHVSRGLGVPLSTGGLPERIALLSRYLRDRYAGERNVVIFVDDAHLLADEVLLELGGLADIDAADGKLVQVVLCGDRSLEEKLRQEALAPIRHRVVARARLDAIRCTDIKAYVDARFEGADIRRQDFFYPADLRRIWLAARGVPRVINTICDNALILAYARGRLPVSRAALDDAIRKVVGRVPFGLWIDPTSIAKVAGPSAVAVGVFAIGLAFFAGRGEGARSAAVKIAAVSSQGPQLAALVAREPEPGPPLVKTPQVSPDRRTAYPIGIGAHCGDGYLDEGEECDDGNSLDTDECLTSCRQAVCGDGVVRAWVEECDDGNAHNDDDCLFGCIRAPTRSAQGR
jgi:general secretion pathway protein A